MIDRPTIERILSAADIVDVVSEFVTLKKAGMNYKGLCPFHDDKTPSFSVSPSRNYCHCFSCGKGGTPVGFIMEHEQMTYPEALRWLARRYHIEIKERELSSEEKRQESERESLFIVNEWAATYYHDILLKDPTGHAVGLAYFRSRGFRDDIIERFRLGFALPDRQALPCEALAKGYNGEFLVKTGLCYARNAEGALDKSNLVDRFAGRAIFPWIGLNGKVVAFGGRKLDQATKGVQQKYVNSPESVIYHKDHELYGIFQAKRAIAKEDSVFMVEGYTDVISMHQCGIENVVANSGTALSEHQIRLLHRLTRNITLLYDGDAAGIKAAMRGTDMLLAEGMNIKVLLLPDGDDPDSFARKHTAEEFRKHVAEHTTDFIEFKIATLLTGVTDPVKRSDAISSIVKSVSVIPDPIVRATYLQDCAVRLGIAEKTLLARMNRFISEAIEERRRKAPPSPPRGEPYHSDDSFPPPVEPPDEIPERTNSPHGGKGGATPAFRMAGKQEAIERFLAEDLVRYGERVVKEDVPTEDGGTTSLTLAEYVYYNLAADELTLRNPQYATILQEAVDHSHDEGFTATDYFTRHPDPELSALAAELAQERYVIAKSLRPDVTAEELLAHAEHLLLELRRDIIDTQLADTLSQISANIDNPEALSALHKRYCELREMSTTIARRLGNNIR